MTGEHEMTTVGRDPTAARRLSDQDKRLVAALMQLEKDLPKIVAEILASDFDLEERAALSLVFATMAADLAPPVVDVLPPHRWPERIRNSGAPPS